MWYALVLFVYIIGGAVFMVKVGAGAHGMSIWALLAWPLVILLMLIGAFLDWRDGEL